MTASGTKQADAYSMFRRLKPGDRVRVTQTVRVGSRQWDTSFTGTVLETRRAQTGLHFDRARDDRVFVDTIVLNRGDGERTTVTLDENTQIEVVTAGSAGSAR
jgi:ribosomal protein L19